MERSELEHCGENTTRIRELEVGPQGFRPKDISAFILLTINGNEKIL